MTNDQRAIIQECVGRRIQYPPGGLLWQSLRKVLEELLVAERDNPHICIKCLKPFFELKPHTCEGGTGRIETLKDFRKAINEEWR